MQNIQIPTCFFPTTVLFVDDNRDFLLNFVLQLDESIAYRTFDNPIKALELVEKSRLHARRHTATSDGSEQLPMNQQQVADYAAINAQVYNPDRFAEVSVVVVDYAMPEMDGLEFCRQIKNPNIKKILLTGQADEKLAVEAFNEGLIHRYITKNDEQASEKITQSIFDLQKEYFIHLSDELSKELLVTAPTCLKKPVFNDMFDDLIEKNGIVEFYLADNTGSFFMLDEDANTSFLIVKNEKDMSKFHQEAIAKGADTSVTESLHKRQKIPPYFSFEMLSLKQGDWTSHLLPANTLEADDIYYFSYQKSNDLYHVRQHKILSYNRYLEELDGEELLAD